MQNQTKREITLDSQLKTALTNCEEIRFEIRCTVIGKQMSSVAEIKTPKEMLPQEFLSSLPCKGLTR